jgi:hypothetical protein
MTASIHSMLRTALFSVTVVSAPFWPVSLVAQAPAPAGQVERVVPPGAPQAQFPREEVKAEETRERLHEVLRDYPPSLAEVLRLDPTLLTNQNYLAPYPRLAAFLAQHPGIAHNPSFYIGEVDRHRWNAPDPRRDAREAFQVVLAGMALLTVFAVVTSVLVWLIRTLIDYRRWLRISKTQTEVHSKLLDRFSANEDLIRYIQTPAGRKFLESAPIPLDAGPRSVGAPLGRILWSVQAGFVLALGGLGLRYAPLGVVDEFTQPLHVVGTLLLTFGIGFVLSAIVSYVLSSRLGLLDSRALGMAAVTPRPGETDLS